MPLSWRNDLSGHVTSQPGHVTPQPGHVTSQLEEVLLRTPNESPEMLDELAAGEQDISLVRQIDLNSLENDASDDKSKGKTDQGIM